MAEEKNLLGGPGRGAPGTPYGDQGHELKRTGRASQGQGEGFFLGPRGNLVPCRPWLAPGAEEFLLGIVAPGWTAVETGAGGSTIWLGRRVKRLISYEHNLAWHATIARAVKKAGLMNVRLYHDPRYPDEGIELGGETFDLMIIDGRGRVRSIMTAWKNLKPGGWIGLDNSERPRYLEAVRFLDRECPTRIVFSGAWETRFWRRPTP